MAKSYNRFGKKADIPPVRSSIVARLRRLARTVPLPPPYHQYGGRHFDPSAKPIPLPRRILVVKLFALGDMLLVTPALRALRERFPEARIDVLATRQGALALARSPYVDDVLVFDKALFDQVGGIFSPRALWAGLRFALDLRLRRYDTLVLLHHLITAWGTLKYTVLALWSGAPVRAGLDNGRGWFLTHRARDQGFGTFPERQYWLQVTAALGAPSDDDRPSFTVTDADRAAGATLIAQGRNGATGPVVVIHPTNGNYAPGRQWSPARFAAVADHLARAQGAKIVLVGVASEAEGIGRVEVAMQAPVINLAGRTDLATLAGVLLSADLLIGNDSSVGHLAAALGVPTLVIFGPSNDRAWLPWGADRVVLPPAGRPLPPLPDAPVLAVRSAEPHGYHRRPPPRPPPHARTRCRHGRLKLAGHTARRSGDNLRRAADGCATKRVRLSSNAGNVWLITGHDLSGHTVRSS
jgi:ADP-heptose:LPS heptosyltransferase